MEHGSAVALCSLLGRADTSTRLHEHGIKTRTEQRGVEHKA